MSSETVTTLGILLPLLIVAVGAIYAGWQRIQGDRRKTYIAVEEYERVIADRDSRIADRDAQLDDCQAERTELLGMLLQAAGVMRETRTVNARLTGAVRQVVNGDGDSS